MGKLRSVVVFEDGTRVTIWRETPGPLVMDAETGEFMYADDHSHVTDMPDPRDDALDRIADVLTEWEGIAGPAALELALREILRETGRL